LEKEDSGLYSGEVYMIFVNFKIFEPGSGERALALAQVCREVQEQTKVTIIPVVQAVDLFRLARQGLSVWVQHVDPIDFGAHTGQISPQAVSLAGAKGTLLNHSEKKIPPELISKSITSCRKVGLKVLACSDNLEEGKKITQFEPDFLAYESPELIGSRAVSVATAKPEVIKSFVDEIKTIPVLAGAGVHSRKDVEIALQFGAVGVLVATDVVLAQNPKEELLDLAAGFGKGEKNEKI
jgi:triosephosphate isomerase